MPVSTYLVVVGSKAGRGRRVVVSDTAEGAAAKARAQDPSVERVKRVIRLHGGPPRPS